MRRSGTIFCRQRLSGAPGKSNLSYGFDSGLLNFEFDRLRGAINSTSATLGKYMNLSSLGKRFERFSAGNASPEDVLSISGSVSLALWLQTTESSK